MGIQGTAHRLPIRQTFRLLKGQIKRPPATVGGAPLKSQVIHFINKPMPGNLPKKTSRALLDIEDNTVVPIIRNPHKSSEDSEAVFYFPGCGSERLFGQVGLATQAMLYETGAITVLPPGYLCCGYPGARGGSRACRGRDRADPARRDGARGCAVATRSPVGTR